MGYPTSFGMTSKQGTVILIALMTLVVPSAVAQPVRAPDSPYTFADFVEPDFPFITTTLNADTLGAMYPDRNRIPRCLALQLGNDAYACFDTDLLRMAAVWTGEFISLLGMPHVSYHKAGNKRNGVPEILGDAITATGIYPGWQGENVAFEDPRLEGSNPEEAGRGPISLEDGRWDGVSVVGDRAVLRYEVRGTDIAELVTSVSEGDAVGVVRLLEMEAIQNSLTLVLGEFRAGNRIDLSRDRLTVYHAGSDTLTMIGIVGDVDHVHMSMLEGRYALLRIAPTAEQTTLRAAMWKGPASKADIFEQLLHTPLEMPDYRTGGPAHWNVEETTQGVLGQSQGAYAVDALTLPLPNRWQRNVRVSGIDFFDDGRAALSTYDGDVWVVDGIDAGLQQLRWSRFASGLCEPMSLNIVEGDVYVFGREGIVRLNDLNGDGEADFYENFSNLPVQTVESREFPMSMHALPEGGFVISKGGALDAGPKTNPGIMSGFRAGGPHSGSIVKVSADGRSISYLATGLREPYIGVHPETGWVTASDQQGHFVPSTPIYFVQEGDYFGVPATAHRAPQPDPTSPLTWAPHTVDPSGAEQVWMISDEMGPLNGALIHLSYGRPGIYKVYHNDLVQGGISEIPVAFEEPLMKGQVHPLDGMLYLSGFQVWDSGAKEISGFRRLRYTGGELPLPVELKAGRQGVVMKFGQPLNVESALQPSNYALERWGYRRTEEYGSGHFTPSGAPGHETVRVEGISVSEDQQSVLLKVGDMVEVMQMGLEYRLLSAAGDSLSHAVYFTVNQLNELDLGAEGLIDAAYVSVEPAAPAEESLPAQSQVTAEEGEALYRRIGCFACHSSDGTVEGRSGPTFKGLFGSRRTFIDGTSAVADEAYLRQSIFDPGARVVEGKEVEMPSYVGVLSERDVSAIVEYVRSLASK